METKLDIYIEPECRNCAQAYRLARLVRARFPEVAVNVVDLSRVGSKRPFNVFAVPTYVLNGETVSLGNPDESELLARLKGALGID